MEHSGTFRGELEPRPSPAVFPENNTARLPIFRIHKILQMILRMSRMRSRRSTESRVSVQTTRNIAAVKEVRPKRPC